MERDPDADRPVEMLAGLILAILAVALCLTAAFHVPDKWPDILAAVDAWLGAL